MNTCPPRVPNEKWEPQKFLVKSKGKWKEKMEVGLLPPIWKRGPLPLHSHKGMAIHYRNRAKQTRQVNTAE